MARDIQAWEYQPLGPSLGKNFLTSVSPWVVTIDALAPFRVKPPEWPDPPPPLPYLQESSLAPCGGALAVEVEVAIETEAIRRQTIAPASIVHVRFAEQYWTIFQMIAHHTSNGCSPGQVIFLEVGPFPGPPWVKRVACSKRLAGECCFVLPNGEIRTYLEGW